MCAHHHSCDPLTRGSDVQPASRLNTRRDAVCQDKAVILRRWLDKVKEMRSRSLCALLLTTAGALVMSSALMGGCFKPEDTFVNYSNASSSSAGVGGAGGTAPTIDTPKDYFEIEVKPDMVAMCGEGCHSSGEVPFLTVGIEAARPFLTHALVVFDGGVLDLAQHHHAAPGSVDRDRRDLRDVEADRVDGSDVFVFQIL